MHTLSITSFRYERDTWDAKSYTPAFTRHSEMALRRRQFRREREGITVSPVMSIGSATVKGSGGGERTSMDVYGYHVIRIRGDR